MRLIKKNNSVIKKEFYNIIIFVQAPADLLYAVNIITNNKDKKILLFVINVFSIYTYLKTLSLKEVEIRFYNYVDYNIWNPFTYIKAKHQFKRIYECILDSITCADIYFFSHYFDWFTCGVISKMVKKDSSCNVLFYKHYTYAKQPLVLLKNPIKYVKAKLNAKIVSYMSGAKFIANDAVLNPEFYYKNLSIIELPIPPASSLTIEDEFKYKIEFRNKTIILFFISSEEISFLSPSSIEKLHDFMSELKRVEHIYLCIKGHPRLGLPDEFKFYFDLVIPHSVPAEFLPYEKIKYVIGFASTALVYPILANSSVTAFSIIDDVCYKKSETKIRFKTQIKNATQGKIRFVTLRELSNILKFK